LDLRIFFAILETERERERDFEPLRLLEALRLGDLALRAFLGLGDIDTLRIAFIIFAILETERERERDFEALRLGDIDTFIDFLDADLLRDAERERDFERPRRTIFLNMF
jgi:hypothetical protein